MRLPFQSSALDERFLMHRLRSTSIGGLAGAVVAAGLFYYHYIVRHELRWDLAAVVVSMAVVKLALMAWYHFTD
jgi:hypothetical protein